MRKMIAALAIALTLTSCSVSSKPAPEKSTDTLFAPSSCESLNVLPAIEKLIPGAAYIPTQWQPAEGTDLEAVYKVGGIACTYGIERAEVGGTIMWAPNSSNLWQTRKKIWLSGEYQQADIQGFEDSLLLKDGVTGADGAPRWSAQLLTEGFWISVNLSFIQSENDALPILKAARDSLLSKADYLDRKIVGCYVGKLARDNYVIDISKQDNNFIFGSIAYLNFQKDSSYGKFEGTFTNGILNGLYTFQSEGMTSIRELFFKGDKNGFVAGYGPAEMNGDISYFTRPLQISWEKTFTFLPSQECADLLKSYTK